MVLNNINGRDNIFLFFIFIWIGSILYTLSVKLIRKIWLNVINK